MEFREELLTVAELAIGVAGFGAIVTAFARGGQVLDGDRARFRNLVLTAASAALFGFLPSVVWGTGARPPDLWRIASALMLAHGLLGFGLFGLQYRRARAENDLALLPTAKILLGFGVTSLSSLTLQALNVTGSLWEPSGTAYLVGALFVLGTAVASFAGMVVYRPHD